MVSIGYSSLTFLGPCPHCGSPLFELSDMWGPFYACEDCGYEFSPLVVASNRAQPQDQPTFADSLWLNENKESDQLLHAACAA
jgi:DNA-directed RNA polymerase subunit M/transcription elongation factor TFIIS